MRNRFSTAALCALGALCTTAAFAQAPGAAPPTGNVVVAHPTYTSILMEVDVNRPAAEVWKRVGKFCDIGEWLKVPCTITSGKDGEVGTVRSIGREVLVGKTELSYTYTQPVTPNQPYILYHGTLEARPVTATTSKLYYTLMWDNSTCADDAARERDKDQRRQTFQTALNNMKILAEGGTLPPGRAGGPGGCFSRPGAGGPGGPGAPGASGGGQPR
ncbi:MAG TPA: hypothetical protein VMF03_22025 [Steroidobacteraceae bacterium]|nr:hypothetical protein [Steroidobacteraceae bacterium]